MSWCENTNLGDVGKTSTDEALWQRIIKRIKIDENGCWLWQSTLNRDGYGQVVVAWRPNWAPIRRSCHRLTYELTYNKIPDNLEIDHLCRVHSCCNPEHLESVTRKENVRRGILSQMLKDKAKNQTHCYKGHPLSGENLILQGPNKKFRACRTCRAERQRNRYHKNKEAKNEKR